MARSDPRGAGAAPMPSTDALADAYAAHWVTLVRVATLLLRDQARAEDIVQDAFVCAYPRLPALRDSGTAGAYLRRSVVNGCRSAYRHRQVENRYVDTWWPDEEAPSAEGTAVAHDEAAALMARVRTLPDRQREVLVLRYYADLSERQIADALAISPGAVKTHAHRALAALRGQLDDVEDDHE